MATPPGRNYAMPEPSAAELDRREARRELQAQLDADDGIPVKRPKPRTTDDEMVDEILHGRSGAPQR